MNNCAIEDALIKRDAEVLAQILEARSDCKRLGKRLDNHGWTLLHHAVIHSNLQCVKLIATKLNSDCKHRCHEGLTPLARACQRSTSPQIVSYLIRLDPSTINVGNNEDVTPLHYAVAVNRLDLVEILVENGANVSAEDYANETPADTAAFDTGNVHILIYLLFVAEAPCPDLIVFSARARYQVDKKMAIFHILFNLKNPQHTYRQRYDVESILLPALLSHRSTSLIPFFIQSEIKWEANETVRSLYERLSNPTFGILAMLVWCEVKYSLNSDESPTSRWPADFIQIDILNALKKLARLSTIDGSVEQMKEAAETMSDIYSFLKISKPILGQLVPPIFDYLLYEFRKLWSTTSLVAGWDKTVRPRFQRIVDCLIPYYVGDFDNFLRKQILDIRMHEISRLTFLTPFIGYCSSLFMFCDRTQPQVRCNRAMKLLCCANGTMQIQKTLFPDGDIPCQPFPLKRLARDAVRFAVFEIMDRKTPGINIKFVKRLKSLDIPSELILYLKYSDTTKPYNESSMCICDSNKDVHMI